MNKNVKVNSRYVSADTESQIVEAARNGDLESFGKLYDRYYAAMVWLAYCVLADRNLAEDAAQEAFALACDRLVRLNQPEKFAGWLAAICRNVASGMARRRKKEVLISYPPAVLEQTDPNELEDAVKEAIGNLPQLYREPLILHYYNGMNYEQMGVVLGIRRQTVKGRLFRARRKIAQYLKRKGFNEVD